MFHRPAILRLTLGTLAALGGLLFVLNVTGPHTAKAAPPPCLIEGNCTSLAVAYDTPQPTADGFTINVTLSSGGSFNLYACVGVTGCNSLTPTNTAMWIPMTKEAATCGGCVTGARAAGFPSGRRYTSVIVLATQGADFQTEQVGPLTTLPGTEPTTSSTSNPLPDGITVNWQTEFNGSSRVTYSQTPPNWYPEMLPIPGSDVVYSLDALPSGVIYAVTIEGRIIRRSSAGTWTLQRETGGWLYSIKAISDTRAWAVGASGKIWRTTDGASWIPMDVPGITNTWLSVTVPNANVAWVAGQNEAIYFFNGSVWANRTPTEARGSKYLYTVHSIDNNEVWAAGSDGRTYRSSNQYATSPTWMTVTVPNNVSAGTPDNIFTLATYDGSNIYLGGDWGKIWQSTDRGASWQYRDITNGSSGVVTLTMPSPNDLWVAQLNALAHYTPGDSQVTYPATPFSVIYQTKFINGAQQVAVANSTIYSYKMVGTSVEDLTPVTNHAFQLTGIPSSAQPYYYAAESRAGSVSAGIFGSFTLSPPDTVPPQISVTAPPGGTLLTNAANYTVTGTVRDNLRIASVIGEDLTNSFPLPVTVTPPTPVTGTNVTANWQSNVSLGAGDGPRNYQFTVSDGNAANNQNTTVRITRDVTPPTLNVTTPADLSCGPVIGLPISLGGTATDTNGIDHLDYQLNGAAAVTIAPPAIGTDTWSSSIPNPLSGNNNLVVHAFDKAGNVTTFSGCFEYLEPTFDLSINPSTAATADIGQTLTYTVTVNPQNGFNSPVDFTANNPGGMVTSFVPATATTPYPGVTVSVNTSAGTPGGPYTLTITGRSGAKTAVISVPISLRTPPNFTLSASPNTPMPNLVAGNNGDYSITLSANTTFSGVVALSVTGLPTGVSAQFTPTTDVTLGAGQTVTGTLLEITTLASATPGTHTLTLRGTSGTIVKTTPLTLIITSPPDFDVSFAPATQNVVGGGPATFYSGTISSLNGFDGVVDVSATASNVGIQLTSLAAQVTVRPGFPANLILNAKALSSVPAGTYVITITTDSAVTAPHVITLDLVVAEDSTGPTVTNIAAIPDWNRVTISWETNEPSTGRLTVFNADGTITIGAALDSPLCTAAPCTQTLVFPGLQPTTTYRFTIAATDQSPRANQTTVTTFADGSPLQFTTIEEPDSIAPTVVVDNPAASATPTTVIGSLAITGTATDNQRVSRVEVAVRDSSNTVRYTSTAPCSAATCDFSVTWTTDETYDNGNYTITVIARDSSNVSAPVTRTVDLQNDFTNPLLLSGPDVEVAPTCDSGDCWAKITWVTDDLSTTEVSFGLTVSYDSSSGLWSYPLGPVYDDKSGGDRSKRYTIHEVTLQGLEPRQVYHYQIVSCNSNGKCAS